VTKAAEADADQVTTVASSSELSALLKADSCDASIASFVAKYRGTDIEFDGSIASMVNHGTADTRYDILVAPGDKGTQSTVGPAFKFEDVNVFDLNLTGPKIPDSVGEGDLFRFRAEIDKYNADQCLLFITPVSTTAR
jgi:hypothetical protein